MKTLNILIQAWRKSTGLRQDVLVGDSAAAEGYGLGGFDWEPALVTRPILSMELFSPDLDGKVQTGKARFTVQLGAIQNVVDAKTLDYQGAPLVIYSCDDLAWDRRVTEFTGNISTARYDVETGQLSVEAETSVKLIEKPLLTLTYSGGGGLNGDSGKRGNFRPAGFGIVEYIEPVWFDETYNIGQIDGYGNLVSVQKVMEGANDLGAAVANYANYAALKAALIAGAVPRGRFATCIADGLIGLGAPPAGVIGVNATFGYGKPGSMMQRIVEFHAGVAIGSIDTASFTAITTQVEVVLGGAANIGYWTADQRQVKNLLEAVAASCNSTPLITFQGMVTVSRAVTSAAAVTLNRDGSTEPRVLNWKPADSVAPFYQLKARTARPARVLNRDEVLYVDDLLPMGVWNGTTGYRIGNLVFGPDGAEWLYINGTPTVGQALPAATYPPAALAANAYWQQMTRPVPTSGSMIGVADGATANIALTSIGSQAVTIAGNSFSRNAGNGDFNACVRGTPRQGEHYMEADIVAGANFTIISLDDDATSTAQASMLVQFYYQSSTGTWAILLNNVTQATGTTTTGLTGKLRLSYDGIRYRAYINATQMGADVAASASNLILWPKWHAYNGPSIVYAGAAAGPYNSNVWPDISGTGVPASNATANFLLIALNSNVRATGNELTAVTSTDSSAYGSIPSTGSAELAWKADAASNHNFRNGFVVAANVAGTTMATITYGLEVAAGTLYVDFGGVQTSLGAATQGARYRVTYDGLLFRAYVNGTENVAAQRTAATGSTYFGRVGLNGTAGVKLTEIVFNSFTQNNFSDIGGTTRPSDNAGTSGILTPIGTFSTVTGNTVVKTGGTHGAFQGGAVGAPLTGSAFISCSLLSVGGGGWDTYLFLDDDATSFAQTAGNYVGRYNASGAGSGTAFLYTSGGVLAASAAVSGVTASSRMALVYDGTKVAVFIDGVSYASTAAAAGQRLWPKVIDFYNSGNNGLSIIDVLYGPWGENAWSSIGGTGRPSDNAGTTLNLTKFASNNLLIVGNTVTQQVASNWNVFFSEQLFPNAAVATWRINAASVYAIGGLKAGAQPASDVSPNGAAFSILTTGSQIYFYDGLGNTTLAAGTPAANDVYSVVIDNVNAYYYRTTAAGTTTLLGTKPVTAAQSYRFVAQIYIGAMTDIMLAAGTDNLWASVQGPNRPSDNATADIALATGSYSGGTHTVVGNNISKATGASDWNDFIASKNSFAGNAAVTFVLPNSPSMAGLTSSPQGYASGASSQYAALNAAIYNAGASWQIYMGGALILSMGTSRNGVTFSASTLWRIEYDSVNYLFFADGVLMHTVATTSGAVLYFGACLYSVGAAVNRVTLTSLTDRYLDNLGDGATYGKLKLLELTGGELRLSTAGGGRRLGDTRNMPNIAALNLGYKWTGAITYTSASGTPATGTISVAAGSTTSGLTINYNAMSVGVTGTNGTSTQFYLYVNDPTNAGGAQTLIATTTALTIYSGSGYVYVGECLVAFPASGSGGGGGGGGGGVCVGADEWVETFDRGFLPAREIRAGDVVRVLTEDREGVAWETVTANKLGWDHSWLITSGSGVEVLVSWSTPITLRDGSLIAVAEIDGQELPVFVDDLAWEPCWARFVGMSQVAKIECNQKTYAAGRIAGRSILTHNPKP